MKVMILAAGLGTRLLPLTDFCPKPLLPLMLRPMLSHVLEQLRQQDVRDVVINLHHKAAQLGRWLGGGERWGLRLHLSYEHDILGTAGGIKRVETLFQEEPFLVMNADVLVDLDLRAVWAWHHQRGALVTMVVRPDPEARTYGAVAVNAVDRVLHINGRPRDQAHITAQEMMFTGIQVMDPRVLERIAPGRSVSTTADVYPDLLARNEAVYGYRHTGYWMDLGVPERYLQAHWDMLDGLLGHTWQHRLPRGSEVVRKGDIPRQRWVTIIPPVVLGDRVELSPGTRVGPYAVLGARCRLEAGSVVQESILWNRVHVETGARIRRCIVGTRVRIPPASTLSDSVHTG